MPEAIGWFWDAVTDESVRSRFAGRWEVEDHGYSTPCWVWRAKRTKTDRTDYGKFGLGTRKVVTASRAAWLIYRGAIPKGLYVLHHCGLKACVNPDHLYLGTHQDNLRDRARLRELYGPDGRALNTEATPHGRRHFRAKVTPELHVDVRVRRRATGESYRALGEYFGLGSSTIGRILNGAPTAADRW